MRFTKSLILSALILLTLGSCSSAMKLTWTKEGFEGKRFEKILVVSTSTDRAIRSLFESTVVDLFREQGIAAQPSINVFPEFKSIEEIDETIVEQKVREGNFDGVIVASLIDVRSKQVLESYGPNPYPLGMYGRYGYGYSRYIYRNYAYMYRQDYYREQDTYVIEARLFDATETSPESALVWSGQTQLTDPSSYESGAKTIAKAIVRSLLKDGLVY